MKYLLCIIFSLCYINTIATSYSLKDDCKFTFLSSNINVGRDSYFSAGLSYIPNVVYSFSIDGELSVLQDDYFVRVLVKGKDGREYLVMESYKEIRGNIPMQFEDYSDETFLTNGILLDSLKIYTRGVNLQIRGIRYLQNLPIERNIDLNVLAKEYSDSIRKANAEKINSYNEKHNLLWRADTTWLSRQSFENKKKLLGLKGNSSTRGIEYYAGGIIEIDDTELSAQPLRTNISYVENFDWRNRHGKNWMTPIKHQGGSNCCFLFACVGAVEAITNLYYNQKLDLNLSEQELISCSGLSNPYYNGTSSDMMHLPLEYLINHGVCDSPSYPFVDFPYQPCLSGSITPNEQISISGYVEVNPLNEDNIKAAIINHGPLVSGIHSIAWMMSHAMVLVGYGVLQAGDTIYHHLGYDYNTHTYFHDKYLTVEEGDPRIGRTYMIYKNSYGLTDNDSNLGYMYVIHNNYATSLNRTFYLETPITSLNYSTDDVLLEDSDGDGYYFWGIGPKPLSSPSWIPDASDGDDTNYKYGPMDNYGNLEDLGLRGLETIHIEEDSICTLRAFFYTNTCVCSLSKLTVNSTITLYGGTKIIIEPNAELVVDGGVIENAEIELNAGSKIVLKNGGTLIMRRSRNFYAPIGAIVKIEDGLIK